MGLKFAENVIGPNVLSAQPYLQKKKKKRKQYFLPFCLQLWMKGSYLLCPQKHALKSSPSVNTSSPNRDFFHNTAFYSFFFFWCCAMEITALFSFKTSKEKQRRKRRSSYLPPFVWISSLQGDRKEGEEEVLESLYCKERWCKVFKNTLVVILQLHSLLVDFTRFFFQAF